MKTILVVDDMAVFREPIAASLRLAGYTTVCAVDGEDGLRMTREHHPDLILLDVSMPKMDGLTFLKHLRADDSMAKTPVILLTALAEKKIVIAAASLGVHDYLLKSRFRLDDLLTRVRKLDSSPAPVPGDAQTVATPAPNSPSSLPTGTIPPPSDKPQQSDGAEIVHRIPREHFLEKIERILDAKTLSGVVAQVIEMAASPRSATADLANLIARDPLLSARVLQTVNSEAETSAESAVTTIPSAIRKVGSTAIRNIAAALGIYECMPQAGPDGFNPIRCWQHSIAVAQLCERLALTQLPEQAGAAYVVGLCHDLGDIFIRTHFASEYRQILETAAQTGQPLERLHGKMFGVTSAQLISAVLKHVGLPASISRPIEAHFRARGRQPMDPLAKILYMADAYANGAMLASSAASTIIPLTRSFCSAAAGDQNPARPDLEALRTQSQSLTVALTKLSKADEEKLLARLFPQRDTRIWIAREASISEFDPVGLAAGSMAKATIQPRLPTAGEIDAIDGILIVASSAHTPGFSDQDIQRALTPARESARKIPVLAVTAGAPSTASPPGAISWRTSVELCEIAEFIATLEKAHTKTAA